MDVTLALLADAVNTSQPDHKINALGIFDTVGIVGDLPFTYEQMNLVLQVKAYGKELGTVKKLKIQFLGQGSQPIQDFEEDIQLPEGSDKEVFKGNIAIHMSDVEFEDLGRYIINVYIDDELKAEKALDVLRSKGGSR